MFHYMHDMMSIIRSYKEKKNKNQEIEFSMNSLKQIELLTNQWIQYVDNVSCDQSNSLYRAMSEREEHAADGTHSRQITQWRQYAIWLLDRCASSSNSLRYCCVSPFVAPLLWLALNHYPGMLECLCCSLLAFFMHEPATTVSAWIVP